MQLLKINNDDIFISYCRSDATTYTDGLANELTKKGFSCFTDALGTDAGKDLPVSLINKLKGCTMLVVVGSPDTARSVPVANEIELFAKEKGTTSIILIDFNETIPTAPWQHFVTGLRREKEQPANLISGDPSPSIVNRIEKAFSYRKSKDRLRLYTLSAAITLGILILAIAGAAFVANDQFKKAAEATANANKATKLASAETAKANKALGRAALADSSAREAEKNRKIAESEFRRASRLAATATAAAQKQQKIATAFQYANESQVMLQNPELLTKSVEKAVQSAEIDYSVGERSIITDAALRSSLAMLPEFKSRKTYSEPVLLTTDGKPITEKLSDSTRQFFNAGERMPFLR
ncbi:toll/interleukin-1 receptor domain-containing protein [Dyadobacter sp. NIV53]|uniref:toll/interleukin-1 receptor domain-containing protein n=1 Tax=Dyadobacter sp. NIV53 TaxID=2861765 RepID=UPI001C8834BE|nr:toll/interleukin-1 receptor domain-containing protein [Dyadobacter sp. NIV53]